MSVPHYLSWCVSQERQRHEWLRMRRRIMSVRLGLLIGGHILYFVLCAVAHKLGCFDQYGHSLWVGFWSMTLIGATLFFFEKVYTRTWHVERPRFAIRKNGLTTYGDDGPTAHYDWKRSRILQIEHDSRRPEFRSLVLYEARRFRWMRHAGRVSIPLPSLNDGPSHEPLDETHVVAALRHAIEDYGMTWVSASGGEVVLC